MDEEARLRDNLADQGTVEKTRAVTVKCVLARQVAQTPRTTMSAARDSVTAEVVRIA